MTKNDKFTTEMLKKRIPARINVFDDSVEVELGWNYPDSLCNKVWDIADKIGIQVEVSADYSGPRPNQRVISGGGPKRYF